MVSVIPMERKRKRNPMAKSIRRMEATSSL